MNNQADAAVLPITLAMKSLTLATACAPKRDNRFHLMVTAAMGNIDNALTTNIRKRIIVVGDRSGSMATPLDDSTGASRFEVMQEALQGDAERGLTGIIDQMNDHDEMVIIFFDDTTDPHKIRATKLTRCDAGGKLALDQFVGESTLGGGTVYSTGLAIAESYITGDPTWKESAVLISDGQNPVLDEAMTLALCKKIRDKGAQIFVGGLGVTDTYKALMNTLADGSFAAINTAEELINFFNEATAATALAAVTNVQLVVQPVKFVTEVFNFCRVFENGTTDVALGETDDSDLNFPLAQVVKCKPMGAGDELVFYLGLRLTQPEDIKPGKRAYGFLRLFADVPSTGEVKKQLAMAPISVQFVDEAALTNMKQLAAQGQGPAIVNKDVEEMIAEAAGAREFFKFGQAGSDAASAAKHLEEARRTVAGSKSARAQAIKAQVEAAAAKLASDPAAAQEMAREGTRAFGKKDRAAALNATRKPQN